MSGNKPVALQLADTAHLGYRVGWQRSVKAELLRQHSEIERLTAERDEAARIAGAYSPARELQRSLDQSKAAGGVARKERDAAIRERDALRAELEALRAQQRGPLTDEEITAEASTAHGYAQGTTGSAMFRRGVRYAERAHRIGQPAGEDKPC